MDWRPFIVRRAQLNEQLRQTDPRQLWTPRLPRVANTEQEIVAAEAALGEPLPAPYRAFLGYAGGWPAFHKDIDILGAKDFLGSELLTHAQLQISYIEPIVWETAGVPSQDVIPLAASEHDLDLFVLVKQRSASAGQVIWLAGGEIDRFADFSEFFASMMVYVEQTIERIANGAHKS